MKKLPKSLLILFLLATPLFTYAQIEPISKDKIAIGGYDVVAYFKADKAIKGNPDINTLYGGITYYFTSTENKEAFIKKPESYLPQYDGYCALAVGAQNKKVTVNPERFKITDGKLYLFYDGPLPFSGKQFNSIEPWNKNENELIKKANANWPELKKVKRQVK